MEKYRTTIPMMPNSLIHWTRDPPKHLLNTYDAGVETQLKKPALSSSTTLINSSIGDDINMQESQTGRVPNGLADARGFIVKESATTASQNQYFNDDTLDAWNKSRGLVADQIEKRRQLHEQPLLSEAPEHWLTTSQSTHVNLLPAIHQDTKDYNFKDPYPRTHKQSELDCDDNVPATNSHTLQFRSRDAAIRDRESLRKALNQEQQRGIVVSRNGNTVMDPQRNVPVKMSTAMNVRPLSTTSAATYGVFDKSFYADTNQLSKLEMTADEDMYVSQKLNAPRNIQDYTTTFSQSYCDKSADAEVDPTFRKSHNFDKLQDTIQMPRQHLEPHIKRNNLQCTQSAADIVPEHYKTSTMVMNSHFSKFL
jgi:hypothetical protein